HAPPSTPPVFGVIFAVKVSGSANSCPNQHGAAFAELLGLGVIGAAVGAGNATAPGTFTLIMTVSMFATTSPDGGVPRALIPPKPSSSMYVGTPVTVTAGDGAFAEATNG